MSFSNRSHRSRVVAVSPSTTPPPIIVALFSPIFPPPPPTFLRSRLQSTHKSSRESSCFRLLVAPIRSCFRNLCGVTVVVLVRRATALCPRYLIILPTQAQTLERGAHHFSNFVCDFPDRVCSGKRKHGTLRPNFCFIMQVLGVITEVVSPFTAPNAGVPLVNHPPPPFRYPLFRAPSHLG